MSPSKADKLGKSSSFSRAGTAVSGRRAAIAAATGTSLDGYGADQSKPGKLPLKLISQNPDNPREDLGDVSDIAQTLTEIGLVNAISVVTVDAYLAERPDRAAELEEGAQYVVVDGHRRLAAAREAGLEEIKYIVDDAFAASDEKLLEAAYVANAHRANMTELEEAAALEKLVGFYGSQRKAAQRLGITQGFISQRLSLLQLDVSLQADLASGERKVEHVRGLAALPADEQRAKADERAAQAARKAEERRSQAPSATPPAPRKPESDYAVITQPARGDEDHGDYAVITESSSAAAPAPEVAATGKGSSRGQENGATEPDPGLLKTLPWHDIARIADMIFTYMPEADVKRLNKALWARYSE